MPADASVAVLGYGAWGKNLVRNFATLRGLAAETWQSRNEVLFEAMAREKILMYLFLLLTVGVASLGIVGTMTLMISERRSEIGILRTLGMNRRAVMAMVVLEGWQRR